MDIDSRHVDETLSTTRAVRKRLDLERPVDNQWLLDCIDLAEQAPTGGNLGSRRWLIVRDPAVKAQLGELYAQSALPFMSAAAERLRGTGHPQEKVMAPAEYLAQHLAEVPAIVIPTIIGRHDGTNGSASTVTQASRPYVPDFKATPQTICNDRTTISAAFSTSFARSTPR